MTIQTLERPFNEQIIEDDPFALGWREVVRRLPNSQLDDERIPLTLEDILHPEVRRLPCA